MPYNQKLKIIFYNSIKRENNESYRKSLAGGKIGFSYNFGSVMVNGSYATDLQNLYKDNTGNADLKNQVINVGLAFGF